MHVGQKFEDSVHARWTELHRFSACTLDRATKIQCMHVGQKHEDSVHAHWTELQRFSACMSDRATKIQCMHVGQKFEDSVHARWTEPQRFSACTLDRTTKVQCIKKLPAGAPSFIIKCLFWCWLRSAPKPISLTYSAAPLVNTFR